jgi:hypothetical protein
MTLICLEGPDKAGKSTAGRKFSEITHIPFWERPQEVLEYEVKNGVFDIFVLDELSLLNTVDWTRNDLIIARHPAISEWVYSRMFKRKSIIDMDPKYLQKGLFVVYFRRGDSKQIPYYDEVISWVKKYVEVEVVYG